MPTSAVPPPFTGPTYNPYNQPVTPCPKPPGYNGDQPIWVHSAPVLETPGYPLPISSDPENVANLWELAKLLANSLNGGMGIAAPQVDNSWQMFIFKNQIAYSSYTPGCSSLPPNPITDFPLVKAKAQAAPVGEPWSDMTGYQVVINPVISPTGEGPSACWTCEGESCLSFPYYVNGETYTDKAGTFPVSTANPLATTRWQEFKLSYYTFSYDNPDSYPPAPPTGLVQMQYTSNYQSAQASQTLNWVLQHETDHVNGIVFTDRMSAAVNMDPANVALLAQIAAGNVVAGYNTMYGPATGPYAGTYLAGE